MDATRQSQAQTGTGYIQSIINDEIRAFAARYRAAAPAPVKLRGTKVFGVVGRDGGYTKQVGDCVIVIPTVDAGRITPHTEAFHAVVWHCLVSHPALQQISTKW